MPVQDSVPDTSSRARYLQGAAETVPTPAMCLFLEFKRRLNVRNTSECLTAPGSSAY